ncbi:MAG: hypothetical protein ACFFBY_00630 [Promethearchaeota archaeon]
MEKKYLPIFICFLFSLIVFVSFLILGILTFNNPSLDLIPIEYIRWFLPLLPGPIYTDIILFYVFPILCYFIFYFISPYLLQLLFKINKISFILRKKPEYGFLDLKNDIKSSRILYRALILSLFTFSTAIIIMQIYRSIFNVPPQMFRMVLPSTYDPDLLPLYTAEATFFMTFFVASFCSLIFLPIWLLEDSGLMIYRTFPDQRRTPVIEGVHLSYFKVLETYTGLATIFAYIRQIILTFEIIINSPVLFDPAILTPLIVLFLPIIVTGLLAIPIYLYETLLSRKKKQIYKRFSTYNLPRFTIPELKELKDRTSE